MMNLPVCKTRIVCTIGPASASPEMLEKMIDAGMNVARLNFSHGEFAGHGAVIRMIRAAAARCGRRVAVFADLPGPKMRLGEIAGEPVELEAGRNFILTGRDESGNGERAGTSFLRLAEVVKTGDQLFINDGLIQLRVLEISGGEVVCRVEVGGELRSRKGLNLPGIELGESAFTEHDFACLKFALENGVDAVSQSFVAGAADLVQLRRAAAELGYEPFVLAKIERRQALERLDEILAAADGIMVARGDLGVEIPIEDIARAQKLIIAKANLLGKPVITATQMLESMTVNRRPTRAEATDVANAILDGSDGVMLSGESAMGRYPLEATAMLARIAAAVEPERPPGHYYRQLATLGEKERTGPVDLITAGVDRIAGEMQIAAFVVPSLGGATVRSLARFRPRPWIFAFSPSEKTCQELLFSCGVEPCLQTASDVAATERGRRLAVELGLAGDWLIATEGPSPANPTTHHRLELVPVGDSGPLVFQ